ncbi:MAG TPA: galactokinase family protein [Acidimicrobiales bacterium]|nr:galactokinase family protein [Acidimicrobiales bacterium]
MPSSSATSSATARAPGRVTLIGDHTDYNEGLSLPMAIDLATEATFSPEPGSFLIGLDSDQFPDHLEIPLGDTAPPSPHALLAAGLIRLCHPKTGGTVRVTTTIPIGAGLSSSAAFSVALSLALGHAAQPVELARHCQQAEALAGAHVGLLDPLAIVAARADHALHIDFSTLEMRQVRLPADAAFVVVHSGAPRLLNGSPYATRRAECESAARLLGRALGRCGPGDLSGLGDPVLRRRARHVVTECARVREVERLLSLGDLAAVGAVMSEGHRSLADDFRVSVPAVDALVGHLVSQPGVLGARMTGGGFGGCVIALCRPDSPALDPAVHAPLRAWRVSPAGGASMLER